MKAFLVSLFVIVALALGTWLYQPEPSQQAMKTWFNNTQDLINGASDLFSSFKRPEDDEQLKALLPSDELDLSIQPITTSQDGSVPLISQNDARELLPDMFSQSDEPKASVKGQVHTDENDNIIGAEVQVAIPAGM